MTLDFIDGIMIGWTIGLIIGGYTVIKIHDHIWNLNENRWKEQDKYIKYLESQIDVVK